MEWLGLGAGRRELKELKKATIDKRIFIKIFLRESSSSSSSSSTPVKAAHHPSTWCRFVGWYKSKSVDVPKETQSSLATCERCTRRRTGRYDEGLHLMCRMRPLALGTVHGMIESSLFQSACMRMRCINLLHFTDLLTYSVLFARFRDIIAFVRQEPLFRCHSPIPGKITGCST